MMKQIEGTPASNRLIIGLDYGTTYTGVSFCETSSVDAGQRDVHIEVIHDWPSCHNNVGTKEKVPSEVAYLAGGLRWGSLIPADAKRHMWTKLELDPEDGEDMARTKRALFGCSPSTNKEPVDIIADFLMQVKAHLLKNLDNRFGAGLWKSLPVTLVITVPAVWSDRAKNHTLQAVTKAGLDSLQFPQLERTIITTEPECAAIYTIKNLHGSSRDHQFKIGDGFTVCDMGGGTVDLISYQVTGLNPTVIKEATVGGGAQCGGTFVDRHFLQWLERRLGTDDFKKIAGCRSEDIPRTSLSSKAAKVLQEFTMGAKCNFSGDETYYIRLPGLLGTIIEDVDRGICDGEITLTPEDMCQMFDFSLAKTYKLLAAQKMQAEDNGVVMKYAFLVGGFAESPYMFDMIKHYAKTLRLQAFRPESAWSAVVRGAATAGLEGSGMIVQQRKCRRYYGTECGHTFDHFIHEEAESYISEFDGGKRAAGQMDWILEKGQALASSEDVHAKLGFSKSFWLSGKKTMSLDLFASEHDEAPQRVKDSGVKKLATLKVDLSDVPQKNMKRRTSPSGRPYHKINFEVEISIQSSLEFSLVVKGKKYGSMTVNYH